MTHGVTIKIQHFISFATRMFTKSYTYLKLTNIRFIFCVVPPSYSKFCVHNGQNRNEVNIYKHAE
jgi:hypothetical protein